MIALGAALGEASVNATDFEEPIRQYMLARIGEFEIIPTERQKQLEKLSSALDTAVRTGTPSKLTFICTHNSRRSHLAQIWAAAASEYYKLLNVETFSGGTEATAFNSRALAALGRVGFLIRTPELQSQNPHYTIQYSSSGTNLICFSKRYNQSPNPKSNFIAVMTCSQADRECPIVEGATTRISVPYDDPKVFDGTKQESEMYDERCRQIAREMLFVFSKVKR